jgi:hypothetical protein
MLLALALGRGFILWDKAASIAFRRPARSTLYMEFRVSPEEVTLNSAYRVLRAGRRKAMLAALSQRIKPRPRANASSIG